MCIITSRINANFPDSCQAKHQKEKALPYAGSALMYPHQAFLACRGSWPSDVLERWKSSLMPLVAKRETGGMSRLYVTDIHVSTYKTTC